MDLHGLQPGAVVDRFVVESVIGSGGTATVYLVRHQQLGTRHALKVLAISSKTIHDRLLTEGRVQAALQHPNIVTVTDVLDIGGSPGLLMEHIEGPTLEEVLREYQFTATDAVRLFLGVLAGVQAAHGAGFVHRDLKPANVLLAPTPAGLVPKVADFGLAKILRQVGEIAATRQGVALGTPSYMAPEQIRDAAGVDERADVFSLGCILYELLTRRRAFPGDEALAIYNNVVRGRFIPPRTLVPDLPPHLDAAVLGCLTVHRDQRIPDCATLLAVLRQETTWELPFPTDDETEDRSRLVPLLVPRPQGPQLTLAPAEGAETDAPAPARLRWWGLLGLLAVGLALAAGVSLVGAGAVVARFWATRAGDGPDLPGSEPAALPDLPPPAPPLPAPPSPAPAAPARPGPSPAPAPPAPSGPPTPSPRPEPGTLKILSSPPSAALEVDGKPTGLRTPAKLEVDPGVHRVLLRLGEGEAAFPVSVGTGAEARVCYDFAEAEVHVGPCPR